MSVSVGYITQGMARLSALPKFAGQPRMLILANQYFFDQSWARSAQELGWQAGSLPAPTVEEPSRLPIERLVEALMEFRPDFVLTSNYGGVYALGNYARLFEEARIPCVSWFTDTPRMLLRDLELHMRPYSVAATWERAYMPHLRSLGFGHVMYLPLATDPHLFNASPSENFDRSLAFVGSSMVQQAEQAWQFLAESPALRDAVAEALDSGRVTRDLFAHGIEAILGVDVVRKHAPRVRRHAELCLLYEWTRRQKGRYVHTVISAEQAETLAAAIDNNRRVLALLDRWRAETGRVLKIGARRK